MELVANRIVWSFCLLLVALPWFRRWQWDGGGDLGEALKIPSTWAYYLLAAVLISINWLTFVWAVNHDRVLEASLGYFITPLLSVLIGVIGLRERVGRWQMVSMGVAVVGVAVLTVDAGGVPWIALLLASSFSLYGLVKKKASLGAISGLLLETALMVLPAGGYLTVLAWRGEGALGTIDNRTDLLLVVGGAVTVLPLAFFAAAARRVPLSLLGMLQYVSPSLQFLVGVAVFREPFSGRQMVGFSLVWTASIIYLLGSRKLLRSRDG